METSFLSSEELKNFGFKAIGTNVFISRKVSIYSPQSISIGNNVRVDDFCILSGNITLGSYIHISAYTALYGRNGADEFLKIIRYVIKDTNIFVISHKSGLEDKFNNVIKFDKKSGFSYKTES